MSPSSGPLGAEVRRVFSSEAALRLSRLSDGLQRVAAGDISSRLVDGLVGDAHALKGAAAAVGLDDVAGVADALEGVAGALPGAGSIPSRVVIDAMLETVDALEAMVTARLAAVEATSSAAEYEDELLALSSPASLARPPESPPAGDGGELLTLVQFQTSVGTFAVSVDDTRGVQPATALRALPGAEPGVAGVIEHAGQAIPVLQTLGHQGMQVLVLCSKARLFGLLVERVAGLLDVREDLLQPPPAGQRVGLVGGIVHNNAELVMVLDTDTLATRLSAEPSA